MRGALMAAQDACKDFWLGGPEDRLCAREQATVVTMDLSARNLELFNTDHWLSNTKNCVVLRLNGEAWGTDAQRGQTMSPQERMTGWTCSQLQDFLGGQDLAGLASVLYSQSVNGEDFLQLSDAEFVKDLRLSPFGAKKLVKTRSHFLDHAG